MDWRLVLILLTGNVVFMASSYTMLIPFLPLYLTTELGVGHEAVNLWSGIVFSGSFVVSAIMAPIWGRMADTKGKRVMAIRASFLLAVSYFLGGLVETPLQLTLMRLFQGFAAGLWPMDLALMTLYAPPNKLGFSLGVLQGALTAGGIIGPLAGGFLAEAFGMRLSFFVAAAALFLNCLMFVFVIKEPPAPSPAMAVDAPPEDTGTLLHTPLIRVMLLCAGLVQMVILILQPILTTYITYLAGELENLALVSGFVFSLGGFAGAIAAPLWGWLGQRRGFFSMMIVALTLAGAAILLQGMMGTLYPFALCQFICGLFFCGIQPSINALLADHTAANVKGRLFGLMFAAQQGGSIAGPILGGAVATYLGMHYVFYTAGFILLSMAVILRFAGWRLLPRNAR
ncbi:MAG: MFS transporter [Schwartzia sp. (in: firmicutes)]